METVLPQVGVQSASPDLTFSAGSFSAKPLRLDPVDGSPEAKAHVLWKAQVLLGKLAAHRHYFTDYTRGCNGECKGYCTNLTNGCAVVKNRVAAALLAKDAMVWEVWRTAATGGVAFVGILRLSDVEPGCTAKAHYMFFDGHLKDKTPILQAWKNFVFNRLGIHRVTIEVPANMEMLARHAVKHLGFGGDYRYKGLPVEGVMRQGKIVNGQALDILILGCVS